MSSPFHKLPGSSALSGILIGQTTSAVISRKVNLAAAVDPAVGDDSSGGYGVGSLWINTVLDKVFWCADAGVGAAVWKESGGGASGTAAKQTITVVNTFAAGDVVRKTSTGWAKAQADSAANAEVLGIIETASGSDFTIVYIGACTLTAHGFTIGDVLFLSAGSSGVKTATEPSTATNVSKPVCIVLDANTVIVIQMRGTVVAAASRDGYDTNTLAAANIAWTVAANKKYQKITANPSGPVVINLSRSGAAAGDFFEVRFNDIAVTAVNTIIIQENSSGSLWSWIAANTVSGSQQYVFNGTSWELWRDTSFIA